MPVLLLNKGVQIQGFNKLLFPLFIINVQNIQNRKKKKILILKSIVVLTQDPAQNPTNPLFS